ncbi:uncharacterized protein LOC127701951 [Mytilus californianus]|uniref:uncharacterized protein LOC127701951 n=1 Tax=Mytilus californianus TaxID=6549 RepID=UPI00224624A4|nr:uncharacterized protein LOC127701951 [Mytilus californianus]
MRGEGTPTCTKGRPYIENSNYVCFWLIETLNDFNTSLNLCQNDNGSLGIIPDQNTLNWLNLYREDVGKEYKEFYIGYKRDILNKLVTLDGRQQTWAPWESGQPSGTASAFCVTSFNRDGTFWDEYCTDTYYAICQWPKFLATFWKPTITGTTTTEKDSTTSTTDALSSKNKIETSTGEVTTEKIIPITTAHNLGTTTDQSCRCFCKTVEVNSTISAAEKAEIAANISKELSVNVETLSSTIRSKTSAKDDRPSSTGIGYVGVILLVTVFGGIIILDLPVFWTVVKLRFYDLKTCCQNFKA